VLQDREGGDGFMEESEVIPHTQQHSISCRSGISSVRQFPIPPSKESGLSTGWILIVRS
jgi:hypothetical protein